jgi:hypothetical protein
MSFRVKNRIVEKIRRPDSSRANIEFSSVNALADNLYGQ